MQVTLSGCYRDYYCDDYFNESYNFTHFGDFTITVPYFDHNDTLLKDKIYKYILDNAEPKEQIYKQLVALKQIEEGTDDEKWEWSLTSQGIVVVDAIENEKEDCILTVELFRFTIVD